MGVSEQRFVEVYLSAFLKEVYGRERGCKEPVFTEPVALTVYRVDASDVPSICSSFNILPQRPLLYRQSCPHICVLS
jgi:hypothetical protein